MIYLPSTKVLTVTICNKQMIIISIFSYRIVFLSNTLYKLLLYFASHLLPELAQFGASLSSHFAYESTYRQYDRLPPLPPVRFFITYLILKGIPKDCNSANASSSLLAVVTTVILNPLIC